ncbi:YheU family protein [Colwelliaceae bacterium 6441]
MIIPFQSLPADTLNAIIESFVLTEGTEYGSQDISLDEKIAQVIQQLENNQAVLVYSELHQTVNILPAEQFSQNQFIDE